MKFLKLIAAAVTLFALTGANAQEVKLGYVPTKNIRSDRASNGLPNSSRPRLADASRSVPIAAERSATSRRCKPRSSQAPFS